MSQSFNKIMDDVFIENYYSNVELMTPIVPGLNTSNIKTKITVK